MHCTPQRQATEKQLQIGAIANSDPNYPSYDLLSHARRAQSRREAARMKRRFDDELPSPQLPSIPRIGLDPNTTTEQTSAAGCCSIRGIKPGHRSWINQDNFLMLEHPDSSDYSVYMVWDGHGEFGHVVSNRCRDIFPFQLRKYGFDMQLTCRMVQEYLCESDIDVRCSGATCVAVMIVDGILQVMSPYFIHAHCCGISHGLWRGLDHQLGRFSSSAGTTNQ